MNDFRVHRESFRAWSEWLHMPQAAIDAWLQATTRPGHFAAYTALCTPLGASMPAALYIIGPLNFPPKWRTVVQALGSSICLGAAATCWLMWCHGPDLLRARPRLVALLNVLMLAQGLFLDLSSATAPLHRIPFQSRVTFLACCFLMQYCSHGANMACVDPAAAFRRQNQLWSVVWPPLLKALRAVDSLSNIMTCRYLYDKVC